MKNGRREKEGKPVCYALADIALHEKFQRHVHDLNLREVTAKLLHVPMKRDRERERERERERGSIWIRSL